MVTAPTPKPCWVADVFDASVHVRTTAWTVVRRGDGC
jgi:hypothetical protein